MADYTTCAGCGLQDPDVDCAGVYHCPNVVCTMSGATHHKQHFKTYRADPPGVDPREVVDIGLEILATSTNEQLKKAVLVSLEFWKPKADLLMVLDVMEA